MIGHDEFILHIRVLKFCLYTIGCTKATKNFPDRNNDLIIGGCVCKSKDQEGGFGLFQ